MSLNSVELQLKAQHHCNFVPDLSNFTARTARLAVGPLNPLNPLTGEMTLASFAEVSVSPS